MLLWSTWALATVPLLAAHDVRTAGRLRGGLAADSRAARGNLSLIDGDGHTTSLMKSSYPWYHSSAEILAEIRRLSQTCHGALSHRTVSRSGVDINVVRLRLRGADPVSRVFILFGEHSRELISPESGLYFLRVLCGDAPASGGPAHAALRDSEFEMVLNGNPRSRLAVERGDFCLRANPNGVDLNRNWDEHWAGTSMRMDTGPGRAPFSEPETRIFKELVTGFNPTAFLTVHSGTRGLYMPWAYDTVHLARRNQGAMLDILRAVDREHCRCPYGAAGKEVGYACPGTCMDWVYDELDTPYVFAFEVYTSPEYDVSLRDRWEQKVRSGKAALLQDGGHFGHEDFADLFRQHASDFVQVSGAVRASEVPDRCFQTFNPVTNESYHETVRNWASAFLQTSELVVADIRRQKPANATPAGAGGTNLTATVSRHGDAGLRKP